MSRAELALAALVTTFAGTGSAGNADGPLASATFSSPSSLAVAANGDVYVADRSLDTIRVIHDGIVRTIVGGVAGDATWRPGGYRDGPAAVALVRHPESIALAPDGSLVIADTWNSCVRRYRGGVVTTIAGSPDRWGDEDGPAARARFKNPIAVAVDARGAIYVADHQNGIRRIAPDGTVTTLPFATTGDAFGLATAADSLFVSDEGGLHELRLPAAIPTLALADVPELREHDRASTEAGAPLGHPGALAAIDDHTVAYADLFDDSIHEADRTRVRRIAGAPAADPNEAGGFRDGTPLASLFNAPSGLARYRGGWLVADMGNHRIRFVPGVDERDSIRVGRLDEANVYLPHKRPAVVIVGNSEVWTDTSYAESIAGRAQALLPDREVAPVTLPGLDDPSLIGDWLANYLALDRTATVVYLFNDAGLTVHNTSPYRNLAAGGAWTSTLATQFAALRAEVGAARLIVADIPVGLEAAPAEAAVEQRLNESDSSEWPYVNAVHALVANAARTSGVTYADLWPAFRALDAAGQGPLYHEFDSHLSAGGRAHLADLIAGLVRAR